ncbi:MULTISPECIES: hypothetical protein [Pseudomonas]|uniref:hypothetical protein n=1 Tax=Pseudomonas TaxID=286 RepID=UPI002B4058A3|nr:hypothetical protein [Pseudomonas sichuanensis]
MPTHRQRSFIAQVTAKNGTFHFLDQLHGGPVILTSKEIQPPDKKSKASTRFVFLRSFRSKGVSRWVLVGSQLHRERKQGGVKVKRYNESHYLGHRAETVDVPPLHLYFRSVENGYRLYVRSEERFGKAIFMLSEQCLGAATHESEGRYANLFHLLNADNQKIDPTVAGDSFTFRLAQVNQNTPFQLRTFKKAAYTYICAEGEGPLELNMRILQRNAPYLSNPGEV